MNNKELSKRLEELIKQMDAAVMITDNMLTLSLILNCRRIVNNILKDTPK